MASTEASAVGLSSVLREKLLEMARVFRVPFSRTLRGVYLPQVLPYFRSAVSAALGLCWKAGTAAEVIALSSGSIGEKLYNAKIYFQTADLFAWTAAIVLISAAGNSMCPVWSMRLRTKTATSMGPM